MFPENTHILVVDDSLNIRRLICDTLNQLGFKRIVAAGDVEEARSKLAQHVDSTTPFDLIISDLNMPGPSGIDFLKQVRADEKLKELPFMLITTESEKGAVVEAATNGVSSYVVKPFTIDSMKTRLQEAWKKHNPDD